MDDLEPPPPPPPDLFDSEDEEDTTTNQYGGEGGNGNGDADGNNDDGGEKGEESKLPHVESEFDVVPDVANADDEGTEVVVDDVMAVKEEDRIGTSYDDADEAISPKEEVEATVADADESNSDVSVVVALKVVPSVIEEKEVTTRNALTTYEALVAESIDRVFVEKLHMSTWLDIAEGLLARVNESASAAELDNLNTTLRNTFNEGAEVNPTADEAAAAEDEPIADEPIADKPTADADEPTADEAAAAEDEPIADEPTADEAAAAEDEPIADKPTADADEPTADEAAAAEDEPIADEPTADVAETTADELEGAHQESIESNVDAPLAIPDEVPNETLLEAQRQAGVFVDPLSHTSDQDEGVTPTMSEDCAMFNCGRGFDSCYVDDARSPREPSDVMVGSPPQEGSAKSTPRGEDEDGEDLQQATIEEVYNPDLSTYTAPGEEETVEQHNLVMEGTEEGSFVDVSILDQARKNMDAADANPEGEDFVLLPEGDRPVRKNEFEGFATKIIDTIDRMQDEHNELSSNMQDAVKSLEEGLVQKVDTDVAEAKEVVSACLKQDYMNHISALRQYFDSKVDEVIERGDSHVAENIQSVLTFIDEKIAVSEHKGQEALTQQVEGLLVLNASLEERLTVMQRNMDVVSNALNRACQLEQFPEPRPIPEGPKVRIMVRLAVCTDQNPPPKMLVPISQNASIADLKHECIRRARQQKSVQDVVVPSKTAIAFEGIALFDDDTFDDIGLKGGESVSLVFTGAEATVLRLQQQQQQFDGAASSHSSSGSPTVAVASSSSAMASSSSTRPPPPMMGLSTNSNPPPPMTSQFRAPDRQARPNTSGGSDILAGFFLDEELSKDIAEREQLDRRLNAEVERMERDPLKNQETMCRVRVAKDAMSRIRAALLDKATYSHSEVHRAAARSTLTKLDNASHNPSATVDDIISATRQAEHVINNLAANVGEDNRIDIIAEAAAKNQARKDRLKEELEEAAYELRHKVRVPYEMMASCEKLLDDVDRASILAQTMSADELDDMLGNIMSFMSSMKNRTRT